jgi:hypothetical protein
MIVLNGISSYFNLSTLLRFLYSSKKTGILTIAKSDKKTSVHFLTGKPVGIISANKTPLESLTIASTWKDGKFFFEVTSEDEISKNLDIAPDLFLLSVAKKEKELRELKAALPPLDTILIMKVSEKDEEIRLQPEEWDVLSRLDGKKTLEDLVEYLDISAIKIYKIILKLLQKNILQVKVSGTEKKNSEENALDSQINESLEMIENNVLDIIEKVFMQYVGPMGSIILDEAIDSMSLNRRKFSGKDLPELIRKLSLEIEDDEERGAFEEKLAQQIKN